jgi:hypothetical protein
LCGVVSGWQRNHRVKERCEGFAVLGQSVSAGSSFDVKLRVKMCDVLAIVGAMSFDGECHGAVSFRLDDSENGKAGEKRQHGKGILHGLGSQVFSIFAGMLPRQCDGVGIGADGQAFRHRVARQIAQQRGALFVVVGGGEGGEELVHVVSLSLLC